MNNQQTTILTFYNLYKGVGEKVLKAELKVSKEHTKEIEERLKNEELRVLAIEMHLAENGWL